MFLPLIFLSCRLGTDNISLPNDLTLSFVRSLEFLPQDWQNPSQWPNFFSTRLATPVVVANFFYHKSGNTSRSGQLFDTRLATPVVVSNVFTTRLATPVVVANFFTSRLATTVVVAQFFYPKTGNTSTFQCDKCNIMNWPF